MQTVEQKADTEEVKALWDLGQSSPFLGREYFDALWDKKFRESLKPGAFTSMHGDKSLQGETFHEFWKRLGYNPYGLDGGV